MISSLKQLLDDNNTVIHLEWLAVFWLRRRLQLDYSYNLRRKQTLGGGREKSRYKLGGKDYAALFEACLYTQGRFSGASCYFVRQ